MSETLFACAPKKRYATKAEAREVASRQSRDFGTHLRVYRCDFCAGYHTGRPMGRRGRDR